MNHNMANVTHNSSVERFDIYEFAMGSVECQLLAMALFSINIIAGTYLQLTVINHVRDNQYATLLDYLMNAIVLSMMYSNWSGSVMWIVRSCFGPLPEIICHLYSLSDSIIWFLTTLLIDEMVFLKLLYVTCWKSVGQLNDDIFYEFFKAINLTFSLLLGAAQVLYSEYLAEVMLFCTGDATTYKVNDKVYFNDYFGRYSSIAWMICVIVMSCQQKRESASSGFRTDEGYHFHFGIVIFVTVLIASRIPNIMAFQYIEDGTLDQMPQALTIPLGSTLSKFVMAVITPVLLIWKSPSLQKSFKKRIKDFLQRPENNIVPIQ